jgi:hypothetical protein
MGLKAFMVYPGDNPYDEGCILCYANTRNQARTIGCTKGPWTGGIYMETNARRVAGFDRWAEGDEPFFHDTNDGLPEPFFTNDVL